MRPVLCKHHHIRLGQLPTASVSAVADGVGNVPRYDATAQPELARDLKERADEEFWAIVDKAILGSLKRNSITSRALWNAPR